MASLTGSLSCVILSPWRELDRDLFPLPGVLSFPATGEAALSRFERSVRPRSLRVFLGDTLKLNKKTLDFSMYNEAFRHPIKLRNLPHLSVKTENMKPSFCTILLYQIFIVLFCLLDGLLFADLLKQHIG